MASDDDNFIVQNLDTGEEALLSYGETGGVIDFSPSLPGTVAEEEETHRSVPLPAGEPVDASIVGRADVKDGGTTHVVYVVCVVRPLAPAPAQLAFSVFKRYRHFFALHESLRKRGIAVAATFPSKLWLPTDADFLGKRQRGLAAWLTSAIAACGNSGSDVPELRAFLCEDASPPAGLDITAMAASNAATEAAARAVMAARATMRGAGTGTPPAATAGASTAAAGVKYVAGGHVTLASPDASTTAPATSSTPSTTIANSVTSPAAGFFRMLLGGGGGSSASSSSTATPVPAPPTAQPVAVVKRTVVLTGGPTPAAVASRGSSPGSASAVTRGPTPEEAAAAVIASNGSSGGTPDVAARAGVPRHPGAATAEAGGHTSSSPTRKPVRSRISLDDFDLIKVIGKGSFGKVLLVRKRVAPSGVTAAASTDPSAGKLFALKVLSKPNIVKRKQVEHTITERRVLSYTQHPFLVQLQYAWQTKDKLFLVVDFCAGGELFFHLGRLGRFREPMACFYAAEIVLALGHLHKLGVVYRDLKPENVLIDADGHLKLADFGLSKEGITTSAEGTKSFCGTPEYLAPEILDRRGHGLAVDWWSFGMLLYEMLSGLPPWYTRDRKKLYERLRSAPLDFPAYFTEAAKSLLSGLLTRDPTARLGANGDAAELMSHPFFASIDWRALYKRRVTPPFVPQLRVDAADDDTRYFSKEFTEQHPDVTLDDERAAAAPAADAAAAPAAAHDAAERTVSIAESVASAMFANFTYEGTGVLSRPSRGASVWSQTGSPTAEMGAGDRRGSSGLVAPMRRGGSNRSLVPGSPGLGSSRSIATEIATGVATAARALHTTNASTASSTTAAPSDLSKLLRGTGVSGSNLVTSPRIAAVAASLPSGASRSPASAASRTTPTHGGLPSAGLVRPMALPPPAGGTSRAGAVADALLRTATSPMYVPASLPPAAPASGSSASRSSTTRATTPKHARIALEGAEPFPSLVSPHADAGRATGASAAPSRTTHFPAVSTPRH